MNILIAALLYLIAWAIVPAWVMIGFTVVVVCVVCSMNS